MKKIRRFLRVSQKELMLSLSAIVLLIIATPLITYIYFAKTLATKQAIMSKNDTGVVLLDKDNKPFYTFYAATYKSFTPLSTLPKYIPEAVVASEDKDFYNHPGFSIPSITRAFFANLTQKDHLYGGSTITQQLVKNALLNSNKNYMRKIQEVILAQEIERRYKKDEILEMYLNFVYYGEDAFGVDNAAHTYFGKNAKDLTIAEAAFLTGLLPSPSALSPYSGNMKEAMTRQKIVLDKMYEQKYITNEEYEKAKKQKLVFQPSDQQVNSFATHFALMIRDQLITLYGENRLARSGFRVKTTLDRNLQLYAEKVVAQQVENLHANNVSNGAAVVMDPKTGNILALVGSANWYDTKNGKINLATAPRSVGSSFKPIVYVAGLEKHIITPATTLLDVPTTFAGNYKPQDYDRKFRGPVTARRALANSLNVPAVEVMQKVGLTEALAMSKRLGVTTLGDSSRYGLSLVLGTGEVPLIELTNAYATFAAQGARPTPRFITEIQDKDQQLVFSSRPRSEQVISPESAFLISSILSDANARSEVFGNALNISRTAAVKTGTAEDYKDALTVGYTPSLVVGVWVGNNDNAPMDSIAGSLGAAPIWKSIMEYKLKNTAYEPFQVPSAIVRAPTCRSSNMEYFISGTQTKADCRWFTPRPSGQQALPLPQRGLSREERQQLRDSIRQQVKEQLQNQAQSPELTPAITPAPNT